jgi:hypothetical protein
VIADLFELGRGGEEIDAEARRPLEDELVRRFAASPEAVALSDVQACRFVRAGRAAGVLAYAGRARRPVWVDLRGSGAAFTGGYTGQSTRERSAGLRGSEGLWQALMTMAQRPSEKVRFLGTERRILEGRAACDGPRAGG